MFLLLSLFLVRLAQYTNKAMQPRSQGFHLPDSLRSKRFCGVGEQREPEERDFAFCPRERCGERQKEERGGGGGGGRNRLQTNPQFLKTCVRPLIGWLWLSLVLGDSHYVGNKLCKCTRKMA